MHSERHIKYNRRRMTDMVNILLDNIFKLSAKNDYKYIHKDKCLVKKITPLIETQRALDKDLFNACLSSLHFIKRNKCDSDKYNLSYSGVANAEPQAMSNIIKFLEMYIVNDKFNYRYVGTNRPITPGDTVMFRNIKCTVVCIKNIEIASKINDILIVDKNNDWVFVKYHEISHASSDRIEGRPPKLTREDTLKAIEMKQHNTAQAVADEFGISKSTLYRSIDVYNKKDEKQIYVIRKVNRETKHNGTKHNGRPPKLTHEEILKAIEMKQNKTTQQVARSFKVGRSTLLRHIATYKNDGVVNSNIAYGRI